MKLIIIFTLAIMVSLRTNAQTLSFEDLIKIENLSISEMNIFLTGKGYLMHGKKIDDTYKSYITWYSKDEEMNLSVYYYDKHRGAGNQIVYKFFIPELFSYFHSRIKDMGIPETEQTESKGYLGAIYTGKKFEIEIGNVYKDEFGAIYPYLIIITPHNFHKK